MLKYKGYDAIAEVDDEAKIIHGEVLHINDVVTFQADCMADLEQAFHDSVDDYLAFCEENHRKPEKPYSGKVLLRMPPEMHREVITAAKRKKESVNNFLLEVIRSTVM